MKNANIKFPVGLAVACFPVVLILVLLGIHIHENPPTRGMQPNACINNLRMIDAAKEQWALEHQGKVGDSIAESDLVTYFKKDSNGHPIILNCPQGGIYTIGKVGERPTCSLGTTVTPAHVLP